MVQTREQRNEASRNARWRKITSIRDGFKHVTQRLFKEAQEEYWTFEEILAYRDKYILSQAGYQQLPYADLSYLTGVWDAWYDILWASLKWTHVLDNKRFDAQVAANEELRKGREHEISDNELSCFCYQCGECFIPLREDARKNELARDPGTANRLWPNLVIKKLSATH